MLRQIDDEELQQKLDEIRERLRDAWRREDSIEIESILGELVELAEKYGIEVDYGAVTEPEDDC